MTTLDEAMAYAAHEIDTLIERYLKAHEALIRHDIAVTGPEDEEALDRPPDPDSPWRRITVEESVMLQREKQRASSLTSRRPRFSTIR